MSVKVRSGLSRSVMSVKVSNVCQGQVRSVKVRSGLFRRSVKVRSGLSRSGLSSRSADCMTGPDRTLTWTGPDLTSTRP